MPFTYKSVVLRRFHQDKETSMCIHLKVGCVSNCKTMRGKNWQDTYITHERSTETTLWPNVQRRIFLKRCFPLLHCEVTGWQWTDKQTLHITWITRGKPKTNTIPETDCTVPLTSAIPLTSLKTTLWPVWRPCGWFSRQVTTPGLSWQVKRLIPLTMTI